MAKGLVDFEDPHALGTVGLQARDYEMAGFEDADLVIAIGYDLVEHAPEALEPASRQADHRDRQRRRRDRRVLHPRGGADRRHRARRWPGWPPAATAPQSHPPELVQPPRAGDAAPCTRAATTTTSRCARRGSCGTSARRSARSDMLVSDVGLHKLWIGRMFPAHEPGTVLIANGLAGMGFALPTAIARKARAPRAQRGRGLRRRRLPDELPGARDRGSAPHRRSST